jgi:hypothetical protein
VRAERQIARDGVERDSMPRDPATGRPRARLWLWVLPFLVAVVERIPTGHRNETSRGACA